MNILKKYCMQKKMMVKGRKVKFDRNEIFRKIWEEEL